MTGLSIFLEVNIARVEGTAFKSKTNGYGPWLLYATSYHHIRYAYVHVCTCMTVHIHIRKHVRCVSILSLEVLKSRNKET